MSEQPSFESFCIIDLFGHQRIAGKVTEQVIGGQGFIRVDVPATKRHPSFTRFFGSGAIYSITPVTEEIATTAAEQIYVEPVVVYIEPSRQLSKPEEEDFDDDERFNSEDE